MSINPKGKSDRPVHGPLFPLFVVQEIGPGQMARVRVRGCSQNTPTGVHGPWNYHGFLAAEVGSGLGVWAPSSPADVDQPETRFCRGLLFITSVIHSMVEFRNRTLGTELRGPQDAEASHPLRPLFLPKQPCFLAAGWLHHKNSSPD